MALIWSTTRNGHHYEVRTAGRSVRLYTDSAFHSQYNPGHLFSGAVWDLLSLPALYLEQSLESVLLLGVGGGTVIHQLNGFTRPKQITGVDWDRTHLDIARRFFKVNYANTSLICADASTWLTESRPRFSMVIDDLFTADMDGGDPLRPPMGADWLNRLIGATGDHGVLVLNHLTRHSSRSYLNANRKLFRQEFSACRLFTTPYYTNHVSAFYRVAPESRTVAMAKLAAASVKTARLRFRCHNVQL